MNAENAYFYRDHPRADGHAWVTCVGGATGILRGVRLHRSLCDVLTNLQMVRHTIRGDGTWFGVYMRQMIDGRQQEQILQTTEAGAVLLWQDEPLRAWNTLSDMATQHMRNARPDNARPNLNGWIRVMKKQDGGWHTLNVMTADQSGVLPFEGRVRAPPPAILPFGMGRVGAINNRPPQWRLRERLTGRAWTDAEHTAEDLDMANDMPPPYPPRRRQMEHFQANETEQMETKDCDICMVEQGHFITRQCGHQSCFECNLMTRKSKMVSWVMNTPVADITTAQAYSRATPCAVCRANN